MEGLQPLALCSTVNHCPPQHTFKEAVKPHRYVSFCVCPLCIDEPKDS